MKIVRLKHPHHLNKANIEPTVMALGFFDGVHLGHQEVINTARKKATELGFQSAVMTFEPHPAKLFTSPNKEIKFITPIEKKMELIAQLNVDILYIIQFNKEFAALSPQEFVDQYIIGLNVCHVVAGFDYSYGSMRSGNMNNLPEYAKGKFDYTVIDKIQKDSGKISSTRIRELIENGKVELVPQLLGRAYEVEGTVIHGEKRGRTIGFPTANIAVDKDCILPAVAVYSVKIKVADKWYQAMGSVGYNPTFTDEHLLKVEIYILDFDQEIYGERVKVQWYVHIRTEKKFDNVADIIQQLTEDREETRKFFSHTSDENNVRLN